MNVELEETVLFLHVALVVIGMMLGAILHTALVQLMRSSSVAEMRPWVPVIRRVEPLLPAVALAVLGTGAWLVQLSDGGVEWSQGWVWTSVVALLVAETVGGALSARSHALTAAILAAAPGLVDAGLRDRSRDWLLWVGSHFVTAVFFGVIFLMTAQPSGTWAPFAAVIAAGLAGVLSAIPFIRRGSKDVSSALGASSQ